MNLRMLVLPTICCQGCLELKWSKRGLCKRCEQMIFQESNRAQPKSLFCEYPKLKILNYSAFSWGNQPSAYTHSLISAYIRFLKTSLSGHDWSYLANYVYYDYLEHLKLENSKLLIVPIPSSTGRTHSVQFAKYIKSFFAKAHVLENGLKINSKTEFAVAQKHKTKLERQYISFSLSEEFTFHNQEKRQILVVDDLITTGSTMKAVISALQQSHRTGEIQQPERVILLSAFYRESTKLNC